MTISRKMQLFETHQGACRSDWHKVMEDVDKNFMLIHMLGSNICRVFRPFIRCMLKWCVGEDGSINKEIVDILTDVETHMADFKLQHSGAECVNDKDFSNIKHLLQRMAKVCLHVLTADSSPPHFKISYYSLDYYYNYLSDGIQECRHPAHGKISIQIIMVRDLTYLIKCSSMYTLNHDSRHNVNHEMIYLESVYDKVACHLFLGCWDNTYLSEPNTNMDALYNAGVQKVSALPLVVEIWSDETLKTSLDYIQESLKQLQHEQYINISDAVKDQIKVLHRELRIIVNVHTSWEEVSNLVDERVEVQALARSIEALCFLYFTIQTQDINLVVAAAAEKQSLGIRNLLASIITNRLMPLTSCMPIPLTLIDFMERVQRFMCHMLQDKNIKWTNLVKDQLNMLRIDLGCFTNIHVDYPLRCYAEGTDKVEMEVKTVASNIESFVYTCMTHAEDISHVVAATEKVILGIRILVYSILKTWVLQLSCTTLPLADEVLLQIVKFVQWFLGKMSKDESIIPLGLLRIQLEFLYNEMGNLVHFHINYLPVTVRMEVQALVINIAYFVTSTLISQAKQVTTKIILGVQNLLASILTAWVKTINAKEYMGPTMSFPLSGLVEKFAHLKVDVEDIVFLIIVCRSRRITPLTDQLSFFNILLDCMKGSVHGVPEIQTIHKALLLLRDFLQSTTNYSIAYSHDICERVANVVYEAEYLMYSLDDGSYSASCRNLWIYDVAQHVELTKASALDILEQKENIGEIKIGSMGGQNDVSSQSLIPTIDLVVGFEDEMQHIKHQLVASRHVTKLDVVSIIGMPGLGKTTLARKVYEDRQIADHFQIRAWCVVSNEYNKKDLLLTILGCMIELTDMIQKMNEAELSTLLHKQLIGRRYLVVVDDVWGIDAFEFLKVFFPENKNGSRILLTSRNKVIGLKAKHHSDILELRLLTNDESWVLLTKKVYRNQECPSELCQVGKRIAESCRGLPLAVVVVAGLLAKSHKTREFWEQVAENLSSYISHDSQAQGMAVLELSYKHLPHHLKPLFLYIGAFPEDREVPVENLIWLWIAEGFVRDNMLGSLEHQAELYLMDLIDRSFIMVSGRRSDGRVKTCIVHDLLRDMCLLKAKEEHLLQQINVSDDLPDPISYQRRLSVLLQRKKGGTPTRLISNGVPTKPFIAYEDLSIISPTPPLYSLLFFNKNRSLPLWKEAVASVLCDLKLLRILHFESTSIDGNLCGDVMMLVRLRYISIRVAWNLIPSSISKLRDLETLIIKGLRGEIEVSEEIWELVKLRHLHVNDRAKFSDPGDKSSILENLETLSTPAIDRGDEEKLMKRLPNVRKLRCIFLESCPQLKSPNQLESLKAIYTGVGRCVGSFVVPPTLKKLSLSKFRLKWEEISKLHRLPQLEILNLRIGAVDGDSWDMDDEEDIFPELKVLKLESLNIKRWTACAYNFPCLEKLILKKCKQLMEIPSELGENNCLQKMEVLSCSKSAAISAKRIEEEQIDAGNESLEVHIYSPANL